MAIVEQQKNKVAQSEKFESNNFSIHQSPEVFAILSDQLYSDKIKAVIRELSTNAVDSVIEAKTFAIKRRLNILLFGNFDPYPKIYKNYKLYRRNLAPHLVLFNQDNLVKAN